HRRRRLEPKRADSPPALAGAPRPVRGRPRYPSDRWRSDERLDLAPGRGSPVDRLGGRPERRDSTDPGWTGGAGGLARASRRPPPPAGAPAAGASALVRAAAGRTVVHAARRTAGRRPGRRAGRGGPADLPRIRDRATARGPPVGNRRAGLDRS